MSLQTDLHCRKGCGFYGNPEWQWHCSKCWREHLRKSAGSQMAPQVSKQPSPSTKSKPSPSSATLPSPKRSFLAPQSTFGRFEDKKKRHTLDKNLKQIFQGRPFSGSAKHSPEKLSRFKSNSFAEADRRPRTEYPAEALLIRNDFVTFMKKRQFREEAMTDISKHVKGLVEKLSREATALTRLPNPSPERFDEISAQVQEFYQNFQQRLRTKEFYKGLNEDDVTKVLDFSERFIMISCYKQLFCPTSTNDEDKDLEIQNRIRSLNWLSISDLKCPIDESSSEVRDMLNEAIHDILEVDGKMAPQDKLDSIVRCSKKVFDVLRVSNENPASADDFLPCLIYVCLRANPPRIQSNINFITRFCNENKLRMGEGGYLFANLCCAISFIENMTAQSIAMDPDEFDSYVSGRAVPPGSWRSSMLTCEGLQVMSQNVKALNDLKNKISHVYDEALALQANMDDFKMAIEAEVKDALSRTPFDIVGPKVPVAVDAEADPDSLKNLPVPLLPQNAIPVFDLTDANYGASKTDESSDADKLDDFLVGDLHSDNASLLSLDFSFGMSPQSLPTAYHGFSAQSFEIPSIACDSDVSHIEATEVDGRLDSESVTESFSPSKLSSSKEHLSSSSGSSNDVLSSSSSTPTTSSPSEDAKTHEE